MSRAALALALLLVAAPAPSAAQRTSYEELQTFSAVLAHVRTNYVDSVSQAELVRTAIAGSLAALDPHSHYLRRPTLDRLNAVDAGLLGAIGVRLEGGEAGVRVLAVGPRSPAERAGLRAGDRLVAVNDTPAAGLAERDVEALLAGEPGSRLRLEIMRGAGVDATPVRLTMRRAVYAWPAVTAALLLADGTGYLALGEFGEKSSREVERALRELRKQGAHRLLLDLRGNPGGLVDEAVRVAALLLPHGSPFARGVGRRGDLQVTYATDGKGDVRTPLVVLVDAGSASAAEALAGALQDHDRALVAGRRTFGKALAQVPFPLPSGDVLVLTVGRLTTPLGRSLQREYRGLTREQYYAMAGVEPADSVAGTRTASGRELPPGPGVPPDARFPAPAELPPWWPRLLEDGADATLAEAVAATLAGGPDDWQGDPAAWERLLIPPVLEKAAAVTGTLPRMQPAVQARVARELAARVALVRWGEDAALRLRLHADPDVQAALPLFARLPLGPGR